MSGQSVVSSNWAAFRRLWIIVAIILLLLIILLWFLGYGPNGKNCQVKTQAVSQEANTEIEKAISIPAKMPDAKITSPDLSAPVFSLNGDSVVRIVAGSDYSDAGAKALDAIDGDLDVKVESNVDTNKAGEYLITYTAIDKAGNTSSESRKVIVEEKMPEVEIAAPDLSAPVFSLNGDSTVRLVQGTAYDDAGAKAMDAVDGELKVEVEGSVDVNKVGEYLITYTATDAAGNTSSESRKVVVEEKMPEVEIAAPDLSAPALSLNGDSEVHIALGTAYEDAGAKAMDVVDGEIEVKLEGEVDVNKPGEYTLSYTATDVAGNVATESRKVIVDAAPEPVPTPMITIPQAAKLYFENDSAEFPMDTKLSLSGITAYLRNNNSAKAIISGYHSASGNLEHNRALSIQRAQSVVRLLIGSGISAERMVIEEPRQTEGTGSPEEARRVEVSIRN